jgi:CBS domain-containing protein
MTKVRQRMTSDVVTIEPGTSVVDAARKMIEEQKGPLPIVAGQTAVGLVTDRDLIAHVVAERRDVQSTSVDDVASRNLVTITPDEDVTEARRLMDKYQVDRVLVVEGDRLVGIISEADSRADEGPLAARLSPARMPRRRTKPRERRRRTRRSAERRGTTAPSKALRASGVALQVLGLKKGIELLQSRRQPPPPRQQRYGGTAGAVLATLTVAGGAAYLAKRGRLSQIVGRFRQGTEADVADVVYTSEVRSADRDIVVEPSPPIAPVDPMRPDREPPAGAP